MRITKTEIARQAKEAKTSRGQIVKQQFNTT
jgi:hypothetical protein